ncbi:MAG: SIS domain-containing protein [Kiritimatiellia bacterium]
MSFAEEYFREVKMICDAIPREGIEKIAELLAGVRKNEGRVFVLGVGGSAGTATHFVNDLRKIAKIEAYTPTDNVSELTARINDEGWDTCFSEWLKGSRLNSNDAIYVLSVGGGNLEKNISPNLVKAIDLARQQGAKILGVVGRDGGYTARMADAAVVIPTVNSEHITPHTEAFHAVVGHCIVSHPALKAARTKWESAQTYSGPA